MRRWAASASIGALRSFEWLEWGEDLIATHSREQVAETLGDLMEQLDRMRRALDVIARQAGDPITRQRARVALGLPANEGT